MIEIKNRFSGKVICSEETFLNAVLKNLADLCGADLCGADLCGADLRHAHLRHADLCGADLCHAHLRHADLCGADLCHADLCGADLCGAHLCHAHLCDANLRGADLCGADLRHADLCGAKLAWQSHDLLSEILKRSAGDNIAKLKVAGLLLVMREKCWSDFFNLHDPMTSWAVGVLRKSIVDGDMHPEILDAYSEELAK